MLFATVVASRGKHFVSKINGRMFCLNFVRVLAFAISLGAALTEPFARRFPVGTRGLN
jgi:hypothetical protein